MIADHFFQAAFGGSFLNHQWLIAARTPLDTSHGAGGAVQLRAGQQRDGQHLPAVHPDRAGHATASSPASATTRRSDEDAQRLRRLRGQHRPAVQPARGGTGAKIPLIDDTKYPNIGDRLTEAGISWNWYSGGWRDAAAGQARARCSSTTTSRSTTSPNYAPGQPGRAHLKDESRFITAAKDGHLPTVSFVKPYGAENEHPGYASEPKGSDHLVELLKTITNGPQAKTRWSW